MESLDPDLFDILISAAYVKVDISKFVVKLDKNVYKMLVILKSVCRHIHLLKLWILLGFHYYLTFGSVLKLKVSFIYCMHIEIKLKH